MDVRFMFMRRRHVWEACPQPLALALPYVKLVWHVELSIMLLNLAHTPQMVAR